MTSALPGHLLAELGSVRALVHPGWQGSGPAHWQSIWESKFPLWERVEQDWDHPCPALWPAVLNRRLEAVPEPVVLIAHSLGVLSVARWATGPNAATGKVRAAFLVAPPDPESPACASLELSEFDSGSDAVLPFPAVLVGSENDSYSTFAAVANRAAAWQCQLVNAGFAGHINTASGHGPWPEGLTYLAEFLRGLQTGPAADSRNHRYSSSPSETR